MNETQFITRNADLFCLIITRKVASPKPSCHYITTPYTIILHIMASITFIPMPKSQDNQPLMINFYCKKDQGFTLKSILILISSKLFQSFYHNSKRLIKYFPLTSSIVKNFLTAYQYHQSLTLIALRI